VILLAVYAAAVCLLAAKHRRRPLGFAVALLGALGPVLAVAVMARLVPPTEQRSGVGFALIMYAESAFLLMLGLFVASLPRAHPGGMLCRGCRYNLGGLSPLGLTCPECGEAWRGAGSGREERVERIPIPTGPVHKRVHL
jgi:hypothetical protein